MYTLYPRKERSRRSCIPYIQGRRGQGDHVYLISKEGEVKEIMYTLYPRTERSRRSCIPYIQRRRGQGDHVYLISKDGEVK